jgi:signal transduction histidine kinase
MKLKQKAISIIASTFLVLMAALFLASGFIIVSSFVRLEERDMKKDIQRVTDRINDDLLDLSSRNRDYSSWDETYSFMVDKSEDFITSELVDVTFSSLRINLFSIVDNEMKPVFVKKFDINNSKEVPLNDLEDKVLKSIYIKKISDIEENKGNFQGIVMFGDVPMLVSSKEILQSNEEGPSRGFLLMGKYLDKETIDYMNNITHVNFSITSLESPKSDEELKTLNKINVDNDDVLIKRINRYKVEAYTILKDIYGVPTVVIQASSYREVFNQGLGAVRYLLLSLMAISIVFAAVAMVFMDKVLLSRLFKLNIRVKEIGQKEDFSLRVDERGKDELSDLSSSINDMLMRLESTIINLKELDTLKSEFISTVSHELRTPLTSIIGFSKLNKSKFIKTILPQMNLEDNKIKKACQQLSDNSDIIVSEAERLSQIVNNILDISKIEAGKMEYNAQIISVGDIIDKSIAAVEALLIEKNLKLVKEIDKQLPFIIGDKDKLMQVIINLMSNAIKFTDEGSITCSACLMGGNLKVSIIDTGVGVSEEDYERVFEKFVQVGDNLTAKPKGTGLGLPICKSIIAQHGGQIWVEKGIERGSNFSFTLPISN